MENSFVLVALDDPAERHVIGFIAGVPDVSALYRKFLVRDGLVAALPAAARLFRSIPRVLETLRYTATTSEHDLPRAEILAVAVAADCGHRGIGRSLVRAATEEFRTRSVRSAKVVTSLDNTTALSVYHTCGFLDVERIEVHAGRSSQVLVWRTS